MRVMSYNSTDAATYAQMINEINSYDGNPPKYTDIIPPDLLLVRGRKGIADDSTHCRMDEPARLNGYIERRKTIDNPNTYLLPLP